MKFTRPAITPGPWNYHLGRSVNPRLHITGLGGGCVASTPELNKDPRAKDENEMKRINAQAIAAVPQMMEALELALIRLDELDHLTGGDHLSTATKDEIVSALQSAGYKFD